MRLSTSMVQKGALRKKLDVYVPLNAQSFHLTLQQSPDKFLSCMYLSRFTSKIYKVKICTARSVSFEWPHVVLSINSKTLDSPDSLRCNAAK